MPLETCIHDLLKYIISIWEVCWSVRVAVFSTTKIFVNGCWVGIHRDPDQLMTTLRKLRREMDIIVSEVSFFAPICSCSASLRRRCHAWWEIQQGACFWVVAWSPGCDQTVGQVWTWYMIVTHEWKMCSLIGCLSGGCFLGHGKETHCYFERWMKSVAGKWPVVGVQLSGLGL